MKTERHWDSVLNSSWSNSLVNDSSSEHCRVMAMATHCVHLHTYVVLSHPYLKEQKPLGRHLNYTHFPDESTEWLSNFVLSETTGFWTQRVEFTALSKCFCASQILWSWVILTTKSQWLKQSKRLTGICLARKWWGPHCLFLSIMTIETLDLGIWKGFVLMKPSSIQVPNTLVPLNRVSYILH